MAIRKTRCTEFKIRMEFKHDTQSPFGIDVKWENPSKEQLTKAKEFILKQFDDELDLLTS